MGTAGIRQEQVQPELVEEGTHRGRQQWTYTDETRDGRSEVGVVRTVKRLERER